MPNTTTQPFTSSTETQHQVGLRSLATTSPLESPKMLSKKRSRLTEISMASRMRSPRRLQKLKFPPLGELNLPPAAKETPQALQADNKGKDSGGEMTQLTDQVAAVRLTGSWNLSDLRLALPSKSALTEKQDELSEDSDAEEWFDSIDSRSDVTSGDGDKWFECVEGEDTIVATPSETTTALPRPLTAFTCFRDLPTELRLLIWRHARPGPRIVQLSWSDKEDEILHKYGGFYRPNYSKAPIPAMLHACPESRQVALGWYRLAFRPNAWHKSRVYFDFSTDYLHLGCLYGCLHINEICDHCSDIAGWADKNFITRVIVPCSNIDRSYASPFFRLYLNCRAAQDVLLYDPSTDPIVAETPLEYVLETETPFLWQNGKTLYTVLEEDQNLWSNILDNFKKEQVDKIVRVELKKSFQQQVKMEGMEEVVDAPEVHGEAQDVLINTTIGAAVADVPHSLGRQGEGSDNPSTEAGAEGFFQDLGFGAEEVTLVTNDGRVEEVSAIVILREDAAMNTAKEGQLEQLPKVLEFGGEAIKKAGFDFSVPFAGRSSNWRMVARGWENRS